MEQQVTVANRYMRMALNEALKSTCNKRHGAILVNGGKIIAAGYNKQRNSTYSVDFVKTPYGLSVHAEIDALRKAKHTEGVDIYVARIDKAGHPRLSRPCQRCAKALSDAGIKNIYYT